MKLLKTKDKAPSFTMLDINNNQISMDEYAGKKVLLTFFRTASCPFCNLRVHKIIEKADFYKKHNVQIICFFASNRSEILKYAGKQLPPFPIIPDENELIYHTYKIQSSKAVKFNAMKRLGAMVEFTKKGFFSLKSMTDQPILPADFLIDTTGTFDYCYYGKDFGDHLDFEIIDKWAKEK